MSATTRRPILTSAAGMLCACIMTAQPALADDWPFFRGPHHDGVSRETDWNASFPEGEPPIAWRRNVGIGVSSVAVVGSHVFTMGTQKDENRDVIYCLNAGDGTIAWEFAYANAFEERMFEGGSAATPTADEGRLYTLSYNGHLHCLDAADGSVVWKVNVVDEYAGARPRWKYASSPLVIGDLVILDIGGENSTLALNKKTGKKVWASGNDIAGYSTPIPFQQDNKEAVLVFKGDAMVALARADGKRLWRIGWKTSYDVNASSPSVIGDKLFISSGYKTGRGALFQLGQGEPKKLWQNDDIKTKMNSCVLHEGHVYGISEKLGVLICISMQDGSTVWSQRGAGQYGTLTLADAKLIVVTDTGVLVITKATPAGYDRISKGKILDGRVWVNPVLANGRIYCRNNKGDLVCVDVRNK